MDLNFEYFEAFTAQSYVAAVSNLWHPRLMYFGQDEVSNLGRATKIEGEINNCYWVQDLSGPTGALDGS